MTREEIRKLEAENLAAVDAARDAGREWHKTNTEVLLGEVYIHAGIHYAMRPAAWAFVEGFQDARRQRDEYLAEQEKA